MSVLVRAIAYAALFIGFMLVFVPARLLSWSGVTRPARLGTALFLLCLHLFIVGYEEPALRRRFGEPYDAYCRRIRRWWLFQASSASRTFLIAEGRGRIRFVLATAALLPMLGSLAKSRAARSMERPRTGHVVSARPAPIG
jgi:hypothetical protein